MKTSVGKISLLAAAVSALPLHARAANNPALQSASRDVTPLTLLTGPTLTSPAHGPLAIAPTSLTAPVPDVGAFHFVPAMPPDTSAVKKQGPGKLILKPSSEPEQPAPAQPAHTKALPSPESLRFDERLDAPPPPPRMLFTPAPKRG